MYNIPNGSWRLSYQLLAQVAVSDSEKDKFALQSGDLLISRVNSFELVGKCAHVDDRGAGFVFENMLIRVRLATGINPLFVAQQMSTTMIRDQIERVAKRAIGQASINSEDLKQIRLMLPPRDVQDELSRYLENKVRFVRQLESTIGASVETVQLAPAAFLRAAFPEGL